MVRRFAARCLICGLGGEHVVGRHGAADTLEFKIANCLDCDSILNSQQNTGADQDLPRFGFVAKPRCNVGDGSYRCVVKAALKANGPERGKSSASVIS